VLLHQRVSCASARIYSTLYRRVSATDSILFFTKKDNLTQKKGNGYAVMSGCAGSRVFIQRESFSSNHHHSKPYVAFSHRKNKTG